MGDQDKTGHKRRVLFVVIAAMAASVLMVSNGPPAHADADSCSFSGYWGQYTCMQTDTSYGRRVNTADVRQQKWNGQQICNYRARVKGTLSNGYTYYHLSSLKSGCSWRAWFNFSIYRWFKDRTPFCGRFYESPDWKPNEVCHEIRA